MVTHLLSTWETPEEAHGPTARFSVWVPAETTCLGRKTPDRCMLHAATACSGAGQHFQGYDMEPRNQEQAAEIIGMDAHSRKLSLCLARREGDRFFKVRSIATTLDALETTYLRQLPPGVQTVLEASTNSFEIVRRLAAIGRDARVLCSDVLSGLSRQDRVNDRIDAENLALTALRRGSDLRTVMTPSPRGTEMRETFFAYRDARKDATRAANRLWSFCSRHGLDLDRRIGKKRCDEILSEGRKRGWSPPLLARAQGLAADWLHAHALCDQRERAIDLEVWNSPGMIRLQQVQGIRSVGAFALVAFVEDVRRFATPAKLVSYIGLNPYVNDSGDGSSRRKVTPFGRADLKSILVEAAQSAMRSDTPLTRWAKRLLARGKPWNAVIAAVARKLATYCWHALMGHPLPSRESEPRTARKLSRLAMRVGKEVREAAGHPTAAHYATAICSSLYGHLPPRTEKESENPKNHLIAS